MWLTYIVCICCILVIYIYIGMLELYTLKNSDHITVTYNVLYLYMQQTFLCVFSAK